MKLSDRIEAMVAAFLQETGRSPRALALSSGVGVTTVQRVIAGQGCSVATADRLAALVQREARPGGRAAVLADFKPRPSPGDCHGPDAEVRDT